jgi:phage-related protein
VETAESKENYSLDGWMKSFCSIRGFGSDSVWWREVRESRFFVNISGTVMDANKVTRTRPQVCIAKLAWNIDYIVARSMLSRNKLVGVLSTRKSPLIH